MPNIEKPFTGRYALHHLGFRPFFLAAGLFAVIGMLLWVGLYSFQLPLLRAGYLPITWHAHEMVFGYSVAVAAGFLLTAVKNWTNVATINGAPLLVMALLWLLARILPFAEAVPLPVLAVVDNLFLTWLLIAVVRPVLKAKQWKQSAIVGKIALLLVANIIFYLGLLGIWKPGTQLGLYAGFYLILGLIFTMGRRVIPFFIERGVGCPFEARNDVWVDRLSMGFFLLFAATDTYAVAFGDLTAAYLSAALALVQFPLHLARMVGWYHPNIWEKPLLWVLFFAYGWLVFGFLLKFLSFASQVSPWVALHAFSYGGVGMMTIGMMARVALGHTGRDVFSPPSSLIVVFLLMFCGAFIRVINVWLVPELYAMWILAAQLLWITAFVMFLWIYLPMLLKPRVDGRYG